MNFLWIILIFLLPIIVFLVLSHFKDEKYFISRDIPYLGNSMYAMIMNLFNGKSFIDNILDQYNQMKSQNWKIAGVSDIGLKSIVIGDLDLLKEIFIKNFDHFEDRRQFKMPENDIIFSKMIISVQGEKWKSLRSKMSPTFTTGKIRRMFQIFDKSSKNLVKYLEQEIEKSESNQIDLSEGYSKFTMDVTASAAFGLDSKTFDQPEPSVIEEMAKKLQFKFSGLQILKLITMFLAPKISNFFKLTIFESGPLNFFYKVIKDTIQHRAASGEKRDDFIQLMLEARHGHLKTEEGELENFEKEAVVKVKDDEECTLDDDTIVANCIIFILGGFDTIQSLLLYAAYALALNQNVQDKLREEISVTLEENGGKFTYEAINGMEYMDAFMNETLRYYPPTPLTDRGCTKDYKVPGTEITIKKGEGISILIYGIHHDEKYYEEPSKFKPERFLPENRSKLNPYAFLAFGRGPRNCIGMRFAVTEVKLAIAHLVHNFTIEPSEKTPIPMKFLTVGTLKPKGGMWLALHRRN